MRQHGTIRHHVTADTSNMWRKLYHRFGTDGPMPRDTKEAVQMARKARRSLAANGRWALVKAYRSHHLIVNQIKQIHKLNEKQATLITAFVQTLGHRPPNALKRNPLFNRLIRKLKQAI